MREGGGGEGGGGEGGTLLLTMREGSGGGGGGMGGGMGGGGGGAGDESASEIDEIDDEADDEIDDEIEEVAGVVVEVAGDSIRGGEAGGAEEVLVLGAEVVEGEGEEMVVQAEEFLVEAVEVRVGEGAKRPRGQAPGPGERAAHPHQGERAAAKRPRLEPTLPPAARSKGGTPMEAAGGAAAHGAAAHGAAVHGGAAHGAAAHGAVVHGEAGLEGMAAVRALLGHCRLEQYGAAFEEEGYDDLEFLLSLDRTGGSADRSLSLRLRLSPSLSLRLSPSLRLTLSLTLTAQGWPSWHRR